jgi:putative SOS response-associated peptidase YedK
LISPVANPPKHAKRPPGFWAKDVAVGYKMINARAETIAEKPAFRHAFRQRRCLVVADVFYEWAMTPASGKQPYFIGVASDEPFAFAGGKLGRSRRRKDRELRHRCHRSERKTAGDS